MAFNALVYCFKHETYHLLMKVIQEDNDKDVYSAAVSSLAEHYQDHPETYSLLQQFVKDDKRKDVRKAAVSSLAEHYQDRPEIYLLLQQIIQNDKHEDVRIAVVSSLAKHYQDHPETHSLLQQVIQNDKHENVRRAIVGEIAVCFHNKIWQKLLMGGNIIWIWIDPKALIDKERVEKAAKVLNLPIATIRKHYEDIAKEIPLRLEWKE